MKESAVTSYFNDVECYDYDTISDICLDNYIYRRSTSYQPPFIYGYQCRYLSLTIIDK